MYEEYPFWNALLRAAGLGVILSSDSTFSQYEGALNTVMSDNICFPAKLAHSHLKELNENPKVDRILMPYVVYEHNDDPKNTLNSFNCPSRFGLQRCHQVGHQSEETDRYARHQLCPT